MAAYGNNRYGRMRSAAVWIGNGRTGGEGSVKQKSLFLVILSRKLPVVPSINIDKIY